MCFIPAAPRLHEVRTGLISSDSCTFHRALHKAGNQGNPLEGGDISDMLWSAWQPTWSISSLPVHALKQRRREQGGALDNNTYLYISDATTGSPRDMNGSAHLLPCPNRAVSLTSLARSISQSTKALVSTSGAPPGNNPVDK